MNNVIVVFDTNVTVSSIFWEKGTPHKIVEFAIEQKITSAVSYALINELARVLKQYFHQPDEAIQRQVALVTNYSKVVQPGSALFFFEPHSMWHSGDGIYGVFVSDAAFELYRNAKMGRKIGDAEMVRAEKNEWNSTWLLRKYERSEKN